MMRCCLGGGDKSTSDDENVHHENDLRKSEASEPRHFLKRLFGGKDAVVARRGDIPMTPISITTKKEENLEQQKRGSNTPLIKKLAALKESHSPENHHPWRTQQQAILNNQYHLNAQFSTKYKLIQQIGEGSFGFVWKASLKVDPRQMAAIKFIALSKVKRESWIFDEHLGWVPKEVWILKKSTHKNIIRFLDYYYDQQFAYLVMEYFGTPWTWPNPQIENNMGLRTPSQLMQLGVNNGDNKPCDLFECIEAHQALPAPIIRHIFIQIVNALIHLYKLNISHRDIKDENIVVDANYNVKLIDFGSARSITWRETGEESWLEKFNGTVAFAAPEIILGQPYKASSADVWSLGVLLYTMVFKAGPFKNTQEIVIKTPLTLRVKDDDVLYRLVEDLLAKMLEPNPMLRISLEQISRHPFCRNTAHNV